jgi:DNA-binding NtrC family response regulator
VIAATNANLEDLVAAKRFREDLYYRVNVLSVRAPALRQRPEDIGLIADAIAAAADREGGRRIALSRAARVGLEDAEWPGNVRQLENLLRRAWATAAAEDAAAIDPRHVFPERPPVAEAPDYQETVRRFQRRFLGEALEASGWNVTETARRLGLARSHLYDLVRAHGLTRPERS